MDEEKQIVPEKKDEGKPGTRAIVALILGIVGIVFCQPTAIAALIVGKMELNSIARGETPEQGRGFAMAGYIMGIIGTAIGIIAVIAAIIAIPAMLAAFSQCVK